MGQDPKLVVKMVCWPVGRLNGLPGVNEGKRAGKIKIKKQNNNIRDIPCK